MIVRTSEALWEGGFKDGKGKVTLGSGRFESNYSFGSRFESTPGTNPEELVGAAHAGCFSMQLAALLEKAGFEVEHIHTVARVSLDKAGEGYKIKAIELSTEGKVPGISEKEFRDKAELAKKTCPVSMALRGVDVVKLQSRLVLPIAA